jgi:hypothetical protein
MSYDNNYLNQPNMNTIGQNVLRDNQIGTIDTSKSDVSKASLGSTRNQLLNDNDGNAYGDKVDNSESANPVYAEFRSPEGQVGFQRPGLSLAYPPRSNQGPGY